ncbi:MAG: pilus assembly protein PilM [Candidatus Omnitrophica bacterium]|nr:pilus assembly protein PilM [Candidatus Omnitrophota bacterium]
MAQKNVKVLEISTTAVKLLEVTRKKRQVFQVENCIQETYTSKALLESVLKKVLAESKSPSDPVCTSVWSGTLMTKKIEMPNLNASELDAAVRSEADRHVPFPLNECVLDHYVMEPSTGHAKSSVMLIAAKKDLIMERCRLLESVGLKMSFMDIHPLAVANLYGQFEPDAGEKITALVHLGDAPPAVRGEDNFVTILKNGRPFVIRDLGDKLSAAEVTEEQWSQTTAQIVNAARFFETTFGSKVERFRLSGHKEVCAKMAGLIKAQSAADVAAWSAADLFKYAHPDAREELSRNESAFVVSLGVAVRGLSA